MAYRKIHKTSAGFFNKLTIKTVKSGYHYKMKDNYLTGFVMQPLRFFLIACAFFIFDAPLAYAACLSPSGVAGEVELDATGTGDYEYCDDTNWVPMDDADPTSATASPLVGHWTLDETSGTSLSDSSGNGSAGTWIDGGDNDVSGETATGQIGNALTFDGSVTVVDLGNSGSGSALDIIFPLTLMAWVQTTDTDGTIIARRDASTVQWQLCIHSGFLRIYGDGAVKAGDGASVADGTWHHVAATVDASGNVTYYTDGVSTAGTVTISSSHRTIPASIGARWNTYPALGFQLFGLIDDVRVYDRG